MKKYEYKSRYMEKSCTGGNEVGAENAKLYAENDGLESFLHTDLAVELGGEATHEEREKKETDESKQEPLTVHEKKRGELVVTEILVNNNEGVKRTGKPIGSYLTIDTRLKANEMTDDSARILIDELSQYVNSLINMNNANDVLVIGLGNRGVTPDALGPKVIEQVNVTRHIKEFIDEENRDTKVLSVSAFAPGVLGVTGIETFEMVKGVVERSHPELIIAIDALSTVNTSKISTTFQVANTGIVPGSGVGNRRMELSEKTMGVPVIAIGVPMVVELSTFLHRLTEKDEKFEKIVSDLPHDLMITPKSIDDTVDCSAEIIARSLNIALGVDSLYN